MDAATRFNQALAMGKDAERRVIMGLYDAHMFVAKGGSTSSHDFSATRNGRAHRVEVKCEDRYADSGNVCVEMYQRAYRGVDDPNRQASGIYASESTIVIHTLGDRAAIYRRSSMVVWLTQNNRLSLRAFGDNGNLGYIVPVSMLTPEPWFDELSMGHLSQSRVWEYGEVRA